MGVDIQKIEQGFLINDKFLFGYSEIMGDSNLIHLASDLGPDMSYDKRDITLIDYPGEFDFGGILLYVYLGRDQKLNYLIHENGNKVGILQSVDVLEQEEVNGMDVWLFADDSLSKKMDQLEMEGERVDLRTLELI